MNIITSPLKFLVSNAWRPATLIYQMQFCKLHLFLTIFCTIAWAAVSSRPSIIKNYGTDSNDLTMSDLADVPTGI